MGDASDQPTFAERRTGRRREDHLVGASTASKRAVDLAALAAREDAPVLIHGPAGSGRSTMARAIHAWSLRPSGPLEILYCHSVPEPLQARELFGCASDTYPALPQPYSGALERAAGGTLVLEGLQDLAEPVRHTLAQALEEGAYRREGAPEPKTMHARIVATADGTLGSRPFGIAHREIVLAPLSERVEDVLPLAAHFLAQCAAEASAKPIGFSSDARAALVGERWPGNVAELRERIRSAVRLADRGALSAESLLLARDGDQIPSFREAKRAFETRYVMTLLRRCEGNISQAARLAKKDRKDFYDVIRRTGVDPARFRA